MSDLLERITTALAEHAMRHQGQCVCGWRLTYGPHKPLKTEHEAARAHVAAMLALALADYTAELVERNRRLANQIVGYGDRMQDTISQVVREAKVTALREAADDLAAAGHYPGAPSHLRNRADQLDNQ